MFGEEGRDPDDKLRRHFAAVANLLDAEQRTVVDVIEGLLLKHEAQRWRSTNPQQLNKKPRRIRAGLY